ncbi:LPS export ABC transporter periplasmic protein LptC [Aquibaculum arenosum]|uniref:LPS export ABC transporter periplasmic protein LptC n=1 Tax=Aquibaculum arenosum TaxID=3032591 RepID=A0ABT5YMA9_9PROT|nr:LPS export ABC transporter periplasmic protein LptC [Fodinicurvata sp. CAU 1616]MDF2096096.1 hypothetical protein [Fodinicurvata sp. CAU 1616]
MSAETPPAPHRPKPHDMGRRRLVALGKLVVPTIGALVIAALVALPLLRSDPLDEPPEAAQREDGAVDLSAGVIAPRFAGLDGQGRPFTVTASTADFATEDQRFVRLDRPEGDLTLSDGSWVAITAARGVYDREDQLMQLAEEVTLFHDEGFEVVTESAWLDIPGGRAEGHDPVQGQGPVGHIASEGFRIEERGAKVVFTGRSRLLLYEEPQEGDLP